MARFRWLLRLFAVALGIGVGASAFAADSDNATRLVKRLGETAFLLSADLSLTDAEKVSGFNQLFMDTFDVKMVSKLVLGRHWRRANDSQRQEYISVFGDFIVSSYANRINQLTEFRMEVTGSKALNEKDTMVSSVFERANGQNTRVDWRVRCIKGRDRIIDVVVEGVSMVLTQRSEFQSLISAGGGRLDLLLKRLKEKTVASASAA